MPHRCTKEQKCEGIREKRKNYFERVAAVRSFFENNSLVNGSDGRLSDTARSSILSRNLVLSSKLLVIRRSFRSRVFFDSPNDPFSLSLPFPESLNILRRITRSIVMRKKSTSQFIENRKPIISDFADRTDSFPLLRLTFRVLAFDWYDKERSLAYHSSK